MELISEKFGTSDQSRLVRAAGLIMHLAVSVLRDDSMAHGQKRQKFVDDLPLAARLRSDVHERVPSALEHLLHLRECAPAVLPILTLAPPALVDDIRIRDASYTAAPELHLVACQGPGLVAEHVFDLTEFFDE